MSSHYDNPLGLDGFAYVEFVSDKPDYLKDLFEKLGFVYYSKHKNLKIDLFRQGEINFLINKEPSGFPQRFLQEHGPGACGVAFFVNNAASAFEKSITAGAKPAASESRPGEIMVPAIEGIGGSKIYFIERYEAPHDFFDINFEPSYLSDKETHGFGLILVDHLTNNVYRGRMSYWADFYTKVFNFQQIRYFDVSGEYSGLHSKAMGAPDGKIKIPLNEEAEGSNGQIQEFLSKFNGEGIQHIALTTDNIIETIDKIKSKGLPLMTPPPDKYYNLVDTRLPEHGQQLDELHQRGILIDGNTTDGEKRLLLQIFSETLVGPLFFEFIERRGDNGFGEGNFKALFESMERDQVIRGKLKTKEN
ncbi:4-hydroxyphenylpyruvate dioxygenase [Rahnella sp. CG8]|uniref:4-hydroxyphenylpyruvate dioxygenase n=1 Tax=Rahnella sp. CG8 TaxID=2726078 RepID=UPI002034650E|nr:4-hydroxyphenylpyruvate dioxygenase [Rahnella sp. CG8]MCM2448472.1 4-hydroxyphenylpyruvate dioxygenase [Rahnella sp. CG8]